MHQSEAYLMVVFHTKFTKCMALCKVRGVHIINSDV